MKLRGRPNKDILIRLRKALYKAKCKGLEPNRIVFNAIEFDEFIQQAQEWLKYTPDFIFKRDLSGNMKLKSCFGIPIDISVYNIRSMVDCGREIIIFGRQSDSIEKEIQDE